MEKFGIFELLDTLSALIQPDAPPADAPTPDPKDAAFAPPVYGNAPPDERRETTPSAAAISSFLEKHERAAKKPNGGK